MPSLRKLFGGFVQTWNVHKIRKQKSCPNLVPGKPFVNYHNPSPGVDDWKVPLDTQVHSSLMSQVEAWDMESYLPTETLKWCHGELNALGFDPHTISLADPSA